MKRVFYFIRFILLGFFAFGSAHAQDSGDVNLEKLQAHFILKFTSYIEWPSSSDAFTIGVLSNPELYNTMKEVFEGKKVAGRAVVLEHLDKLDGKHNKKNYSIIHAKQIDVSLVKELNLLNSAGLLTISQDPSGLQGRALINFYVSNDGKLRFEIDNSKAEQHQLKINSRLLNLAKNSK